MCMINKLMHIWYFHFSDDDLRDSYGTPMGGNSQLGGETDSSMRSSPPLGAPYMGPYPGTPPYLGGSPYPPYYGPTEFNGGAPPPRPPHFPEFPPSPASWLDEVEAPPNAPAHY